MATPAYIWLSSFFRLFSRNIVDGQEKFWFTEVQAVCQMYVWLAV